MNAYKGTANAGKSSFNLSYVITHKTLQDFSKAIMSGNIISGQDVDTNKMFAETSQFVSAIKYFPINISKFLPDNLLQLKKISLANKVTEYKGYSIPAHPTIDVGSGITATYKTLTKICQFYFNKSDFSFIDIYRNSYKLWLPFYKFIDLEINKLLDKWLTIYLDLDFSTGDTTYYLAMSDSKSTSFEDSIIVNILTFQMYMNIPIGRNSAEKQNLEVARIGTDTIIKSIVGGVATIASLASGGPLGGVIAATTGVTTIGNVASGVTNMLFEDSKNTSMGGGTSSGNVSSWNVSRQCFILKIAQDEIPNYDEGFKHQIGRLLNEEKTLGDLTGMTLVGTAHLDGLAGATKKEIDEISKILASGVIL